MELRRARRWAAALLATGLLAAACSGDDGADGGAGNGPASGEVVAQVASYDLAAGSPTRFLVGLLTPENLFVTGGVADLRFFYLGEGEAEGEPEPAGTATASFLALPGDEHEHEEHAHTGPASHARGVYVAEDVSFDRPGFWEVEITTEVEGESRSGTAAFEVLPEHRVPAVGDRAPRTENLTLDAEEAPPGAVDSRAEGGGEVPDAILHRATIADAIEAGRPVLAVFSTPVYCVSQFCGPITDMIEDLAREHGDRAEFVHVEIWRNFQERVVNRAAADWLLHDQNLQEPWVFLVGADGRIAARWDNVATRAEIEPLLEELPRLG